MGLFDNKEPLCCFLAEFFATGLFVFFGAGSVSAAVQAAGAVVEPVNYALSFGFAITILAFSIGDVSGAHINPAVTLSLAVTRNISPERAVSFIVAQITGGLFGGGVLRAAIGKEKYKSGIGLAPELNGGSGFIMEYMGTFLLIFVVFNVAVWARKPTDDFGGGVVAALAPIPIGLAVMVSHLTLGPFTGCGINPARVIGAVVYEDGFWDGHAGSNFWIYIVGPFVASITTPFVYGLMEGNLTPGGMAEFAKEKTKISGKTAPDSSTTGDKGVDA
eukprot:6702453-Prymnesium_polylepis.1